MYSYEIENLLKLKNYLLDIKDYINILDNSPQINKVKYENDNFNIWTDDGYKFTFKIKEGK